MSNVTQYCKTCGAALNPSLRFCEMCGQPVIAPSTESPPPAHSQPQIAVSPAAPAGETRRGSQSALPTAGPARKK